MTDEELEKMSCDTGSLPGHVIFDKEQFIAGVEGSKYLITELETYCSNIIHVDDDPKMNEAIQKLKKFLGVEE